MRVLFISYFFEPFGGVGAKRMSYWANNLRKHSIESHVLTATKQPKENPNITYIPAKASTSLLRYFIKDPGLNWITELQNYFDLKTEFKYDFVIISGGPFMHFPIGNYLSKKFGTKVLLDFRDPFSDNPSFKDNWLKKTIKSFFERQFIRGATALVTVNKFCASLIANSNKPVHLIDNGFNEAEVSATYNPFKNKTPIIAHAGTFIHGVRSPEVFLETLNESFKDKIEFHQYGKDSPYFEPYRHASFFTYRGMRDYKVLMKELARADICLLITEGKSFESTTKVFDYIGLNKKILILTGGEPKTGNLHELTKTYPNLVWAKQAPQAIKEAMDELIRMEVKPFDAYPYSRAHSLDRLVALLKSL
ncbi:MAG TPA: hypothetical protein EYN27_07770 [Rhodospirillales bacterium]|nr:hypothetical protein [Rhodospirillales bacterium]